MEDLAYRRLIDLYYANESPIPLDLKRASKLIGMQDHTREVYEIISEFFIKSEDGYHNERCDAELEKYRAKSARARDANISRWHKPTK